MANGFVFGGDGCRIAGCNGRVKRPDEMQRHALVPEHQHAILARTLASFCFARHEHRLGFKEIRQPLTQARLGKR